ncbi:MAG: hypothetical protein ACYC1D_00510 [Acidimicrobiales bacterium]
MSGTVKGQAARVTDEMVEQGRGLTEEAKSQLEQQAHAQSIRVADALAALADEMVALAEGRPHDAENVRGYASTAAETVYNAADRIYDLASELDTRGISSVLDDVQSFARRRPAAFLLGAAAAGFGIGRAVRANSGQPSANDGLGSNVRRPGSATPVSGELSADRRPPVVAVNRAAARGR